MIDIIITFMSNDRPGIVESISKQVAELKGSWLHSRLIHLGGKFSGLIEVCINEKNLEALKSNLNNIEGVTFSFDYINRPEEEKESIQYNFTIQAHDRPGIVNELTAMLNNLNINVLELNTNCGVAPMSSEILFIADLWVELPSSVSEEDLIEGCESLSDDLTIDFE